MMKAEGILVFPLLAIPRLDVGNSQARRRRRRTAILRFLNVGANAANDVLGTLWVRSIHFHRLLLGRMIHSLAVSCLLLNYCRSRLNRFDLHRKDTCIGTTTNTSFILGSGSPSASISSEYPEMCSQPKESTFSQSWHDYLPSFRPRSTGEVLHLDSGCFTPRCG